MPRRQNAPAAKRRRACRIDDGVSAFQQDFMGNLFYQQGKFPDVATRNDLYLAMAHTVRDRLLRRWVHTAQTYFKDRCRTVAYLSAEYLLGPHLGNNLVNLGMMEDARRAMQGLGLRLDDLLDQEEEPGLGNGGLGRLAAGASGALPGPAHPQEARAPRQSGLKKRGKSGCPAGLNAV